MTKEIGEGKSLYQKAMLGIAGQIAELGYEKVGQNNLNDFFLTFDRSGLLKKIKEILFREFAQDENQKKKEVEYSDFTLNLAQTIGILYKARFDRNNKSIIITEWKFIQLQIEGVLSYGGYVSCNSIEIRNALTNIICAYRQLRQGSHYHTPLKDVEKSVEEQVECEGGIEEIEAQLFHSKMIKFDDIIYLAKGTKYEIFNIKKNQTNLPRYF
ncbi:MAG: hypothetical protein EZS28_022949 [Streblomastix strix]|uniref:Uncharacterized protein n=1 Tax=Streblomastix strix TaxID=222440 RepID=A0A5J4VGH2_9EUKA|nr:MAG: hypothetical protein EZS28_022949 [Streblomastix strix]